MAEPAPQRLSNVGVPRAVAYGLLVGAAAYLVASVYGPDDVVVRLMAATALAAGYVGAVHAVGVLRGRRTTRE